jgi:hypothetical protein
LGREGRARSGLELQNHTDDRRGRLGPGGRRSLRIPQG